MHKILLVEDSKEIFTMVKQAIGNIIHLEWVTSIENAKALLRDHPDLSLVLLDIELPDGNGIDLCSYIQSTKADLPIFFLSSHDDLSEKVLGFSAGADDYITKPFAPLELKARIEAKLKKVDYQNESSDLMIWRELEVNKSSQEVKVSNEGTLESRDLTSLEFRLLLYFIHHLGAVVPRDQILNDIWGEDVHVYARSVDTHVSKLRKKLSPQSHIIESVHGQGYKFKPTSK